MERYDKNVVVCFLAGIAVTQMVFDLQHTTTLQSVARTHTCRCGRTYKQTSSLNRHMRYECGQTNKNQECHLCGRKYYRPDTLQDHFQNCLAKYRERNGCWVLTVALLYCMKNSWVWISDSCPPLLCTCLATGYEVFFFLIRRLSLWHLPEITCHIWVVWDRL